MDSPHDQSQSQFAEKASNACIVYDKATSLLLCIKHDSVERKTIVNNCCPLNIINKPHHCLHAGKRSYAKRLTSVCGAQTAQCGTLSEDFIIQPRSCPLSNTSPVLRLPKNVSPVSNGGLYFISTGSRRDT